jgi:hypothetical protein
VKYNRNAQLLQLEIVSFSQLFFLNHAKLPLPKVVLRKNFINYGYFLNMLSKLSIDLHERTMEITVRRRKDFLVSAW